MYFLFCCKDGFEMLFPWRATLGLLHQTPWQNQETGILGKFEVLFNYLFIQYHSDTSIYVGQT